MEPDCLLFDQAASAPEPEPAGEVLDTMRLRTDAGMTLICVTRETGFASDAFDRAARVDDDGIEEFGPPSRVTGAPRSERTSRFLAKMRRGSPVAPEPDSGAGAATGLTAPVRDGPGPLGKVHQTPGISRQALPADRRRDGRRQSIGCFLRPACDAGISCNETCDGDGRPAR